MHAFDVAKLAGPEIRVRRARAGETLTTLDGAGAYAGRHDAGHRRSRTSRWPLPASWAARRPKSSVGHDHAWRSRARGSCRRRCASTSRRTGPQDRSVRSVRTRRGHHRARCALSAARCDLLDRDRRRARLVGGVSDVYPRPFEPGSVTLLRAHARSAARRSRARRRRRSASSTQLGFSRRADRRRLARSDVPRVPRGRRPGGRPHRGSRPALGLRPDSGDVPAAAADAAARMSPASRATGCCAGCSAAPACRKPARSRSSSAKRPRRLRPAGKQLVSPSPIRCRRNSPCCGRRCCPACSTPWSTTAGAKTDDVRLFETGAVFPPDGEAARVGWLLAGTRGSHWSDQPEPVDLFDAKGVAELHRRGSRRDASGVARPTARPWFVAGRAAELSVRANGADRDRCGSVGQLAPALAGARGLGQGGASSAANSTTPCSPRLAPRATSHIDSRCRAIRRSCATCRFSSAIACQPPTFVARSARPRRARSCPCTSSIAIRARACRTAW